MPQPKHPAGNGENFVRHVVTDPKNVPDVMLLHGYLGASSEEDHERLYLSPDLSNYVDVPSAAILHRAQSSTEHDPLGGVILWVKKDAALKHKMAPAQQAAQQQLAAYFAGALQAGGGAGPAGIPPLPQTAPPAFCPVTINTCHVSCAATCVATCQATCHATCPPHATCGATCIVTCAHSCAATCVATCVQSCAPTCIATCAATCAATCQVTCAPGCTGHVTCAHFCTHITPCVTHAQPNCPFPSEIPAQCTHVVNCVHPPAQAAMAAPQAAMGAGEQIACIRHTHIVPTIICSFACPTHFNTPCVTPCMTCNLECVVGPGGGPVEQAQFCIAGSVRPPQVTINCTIGGGCQSLPCPSWQHSCGWGCPPRTPQCPW